MYTTLTMTALFVLQIVSTIQFFAEGDQLWFLGIFIPMMLITYLGTKP